MKGNLINYLLSTAMRIARICAARFRLIAQPVRVALAILLSVSLALAEENPELARALKLSDQAGELYQSGRYHDAIPLVKEALAIWEKVLGSKHPTTATGLNNLALLYESMGDYEEAEYLFVRALRIREKTLGASHPDTATSLQDLAKLYQTMGEYAKAEPLYERALPILEKMLGPEHPDLASNLNNLAVLYRVIGKYAEAEPLYLRALAIDEKAFGVDHPRTAASLNNLATLYTSMGDFAKAQPLFGRALAIREKALGADHPSTATTLNNLASLYSSMGNYTKAEPLFARALAIREKALGADNPYTATSLNNLAELYFSMGSPEKAEPLYVRALAILEKALGEGHPETATTLDNLALLYFSTGNYGKAEPLYIQSLAISEQTFGADHPTTAARLNSLAELYSSMGNYAAAAPLFERAIAICERVFGIDHPATAKSLDGLGGLYLDTGNYVRAEPLYIRALAIREKAFGAANTATATSMNNLAKLYYFTGNYAKAKSLYMRALKIFENVLGAEHPTTATSLNNLAELYQQTGDYAKAEPLYERALKIREKELGGEHPDTVRILNNLAAFYRAIGNYAKAEPLYQRALASREKTFGVDDREAARSLNGLALLYDSIGDYAKAEPLYERALKICEKTLGAEHPETATSLNNLAAHFRRRGNYTKAEPLYERALKICEKTLGTEHPHTAANLNNLALLYHSMGNYAQAELFYERALEIAEKTLGEDYPGIEASLNNLALLQIDKDMPAKALKRVTQAEQAREKRLSKILSFSSEQQRSDFQKAQGPYDIVATLGNAALIARTLLHWKGVVLDSVLEDRAVAKVADAKGLHEQLETMKNLQAQLWKLTFELPKDASEAVFQSRLQQQRKLSEEREKMEATLARNVAALGLSRRALEVKVEELQTALGAQEALVEFIGYSHYLGKNEWETRYGAVIFAPNGDIEWIPLEAAEEIEKTVWLYQRSARMETDKTTLRATLENLYGKIWAPIEKALPEKTKIVVISPDSELSFVSFATLLDEEGRFLAEKYSLRYVSSGRDLLRNPSKEVSGKQQLIALYGNPDFQIAQMQETATESSGKPAMAMKTLETRDLLGIALNSLAGTAAECEALAKMARQTGGYVEVRTGSEATEMALHELESPRVLHLATHGFFLPEIEFGTPVLSFEPSREIPRAKLVNPMRRSGLALAGAQATLEGWSRGEVPPSDNDGILTAEEVGTLNLAGTWLVTLSACETGTGQARAGEGVLGLRRGFIMAGAENLLMTLWPISDEMTVQIMLDFYKRAFESGNAPQALADMQREWLVKLRKEKGLLEAVNLAGPFIMSSVGSQK